LWSSHKWRLHNRKASKVLAENDKLPKKKTHQGHKAPIMELTWISECCGAGPYLDKQVQEMGHSHVGICSACKELVDFVKEKEEKKDNGKEIY